MAMYGFSSFSPIDQNLPFISDVVSSVECCLPANRRKFSTEISKVLSQVNVNKRIE